MNQSIEYLAKTCANIIKAQGLSQADAILVGSKIVELVASGSPPVTKNTDSFSPPKETPPAPPQVIAKAGAECACSQCNKVVYKRTGDILSTMRGEDFTKAFAVVGHNKEVNKFQNINGNVLVDCPVCGADASVALAGNVISHQYSSDVVV